MYAKTSQSKRILQRAALLVLSGLLLGGGLVLVSSLSAVEAGPIQGEGYWTDTFTDTLGISLMNNTTVDTVQEQVVLSPTQIFAQTDWGGGPGLVSTTTTTDRYDSGKGVDTTTDGQVSLGYTLAADGSRADLNQDGYLDLVFSNYCSGTTPVNWSYGIDSYVYWGGPGGYTTTRRLGLPTLGASSNAVADLNEDGYLDIVFSNVGQGFGSIPNPDGVNSYIYWGSNLGYTVSNRTELPTSASNGCSVADLDQDGSLDIVFGNYVTTTAPYYEIDSYIYWGDNGSYSTSARTDLPTKGTVANYAVDLDQDGYLDIIFSNYQQSGPITAAATYEIGSYIYWGDGTRNYTNTRRIELPTIGAHGSSVADLDKDGAPDIVFSNRNSADGITYTYQISSYIYWGDNGNRRNYTITSRSELPTMGSYGNSIADLDRDTWPDIIFSNHQSSQVTHTVDSYIYWGSSTGYTTTNRAGLPTVGASGNTVGDLDHDGDWDIVFSNRRNRDNHNQNSYIYWNDGGFSGSNREELPTLGSIGNSTVGSPIASANTTFGVIYAQPITGSVTLTDVMITPRIYAPTGVITSAGFGGGVVHYWKKAVWNAAVLAGTNITIEVATSNDGSTWSSWSLVGSSITGTNQVTLSVQARYLRYRATLQSSSDHLSTPILYDITFYGDYQPSGNATSVPIAPASLGAWQVITWTADISAGQAITIQVLDSGGALIPDTDLTGNAAGFSSSPVDISALDVITYPSLTLKAFLATTAVTTTPALKDWSVSWELAGNKVFLPIIMKSSK